MFNKRLFDCMHCRYPTWLEFSFSAFEATGEKVFRVQYVIDSS
jgi:hypothetical protein